MKTVSAYYRARFDIEVVFQTAFHLGSGMEGEAGSDQGIISDAREAPFLPGSSLKGVFRSTVEKLIATLQDEKIWACGLQNGLYTDKQCIGGDIKGDTYKKANEAYQNSDGKNVEPIVDNRCSVCALFGSPLSSGRIYFDDAFLLNPDEFVLARRDGVGISRDSGTSVDKVKYNYDVANAGLRYGINIEAEQPTTNDMAILALGLLEWLHVGLRIGGKTSRGLGHAVVDKISMQTVDFSDPKQRKSYIIHGEMEIIAQAEQFLQEYIEKFIK